MGSQYLFALFWSANYIMDVGGEPEKPTNDFERGITLFICMVWDQNDDGHCLLVYRAM